MMHANTNRIDRRQALIIVAAVPAAVALAAAPALASAGADTELRRLWAKYLAQLRVMKLADEAKREPRAAFDAECPPCPDDVLPGVHWGSKPVRALWRKHGLEVLYRAAEREHPKLIRLTKAIRKAKAETLFGIGVKLSVSEHFEEFDIVEGADDARREIGRLIGYDFVAKTGSLVGEV